MNVTFLLTLLFKLYWIFCPGKLGKYGNLWGHWLQTFFYIKNFTPLSVDKKVFILNFIFVRLKLRTEFPAELLHRAKFSPRLLRTRSLNWIFIKDKQNFWKNKLINLFRDWKHEIIIGSFRLTLIVRRGVQNAQTFLRPLFLFFFFSCHYEHSVKLKKYCDASRLRKFGQNQPPSLKQNPECPHN